MAGLTVDRPTLRAVSGRVAGNDTLLSSYHSAALIEDFAELTVVAEQLVAAETGLTSALGPAKPRVVTRAEWIEANAAAFERLLSPLSDKLLNKTPNPTLETISSKLYGAQLGGVLGWMSGRVLGQYDLLVADTENVGDEVLYVGANVLQVEKTYGFAPRQFRLWLALHEVTHRMQFTGVPWMREYFSSLVSDVIATTSTSPQAIFANLRRAAGDIARGIDPFAESGIAGVTASAEQRLVLTKISGLMSLLEGHGDVVMNRAGIGHVADAERFARVLSERRSESRGVSRFAQRLLGIEAKLKQYEAGEKFIAEVETAGGRELFDQVWKSSDQLPTQAEITDPALWISRVGAVPIG